MKQLIADVHTYTIASGHAYGIIREMAGCGRETSSDFFVGKSDNRY